MRACQPGFIDDLEAQLGKPVVTSTQVHMHMHMHMHVHVQVHMHMRVCAKPVVTSTQAFLWRLLRVAGVHDQISGYGALLANH